MTTNDKKTSSVALVLYHGTLAAFVMLATMSYAAETGIETETETMEVFGQAIASGYNTMGTQNHHVELDELIRSPINLAELLATLPGVYLTESGGLMQTISIRGLGRQGVSVLLDGIPVTTNRRAGTGLHFVDPALLSDVHVLSGPASAIYGAGALGGAISVSPRWFDKAEAGFHYDSNGHAKRTYFGVGNDQHSFAMAQLKSDNSTSADGTELNDHASRTSVLYVGHSELGRGELEWLLAPAQLRDMGRVANDVRVTNAPEEEHVPVRLAYRTAQWESALSYYAFDVHSHIADRVANTTNLSHNEGTQYTATVHRNVEALGGKGLLGIEIAQRDSVSATETAINHNTGVSLYSNALPDAEEINKSFITAWSWFASSLDMHSGLRFTQHEQSASEQATIDDSAFSFTFGAKLTANDKLSLGMSFNNSVRFPALLERYFDGTTPRGRTFGNAGLDAEKARSLELSAEWSGNFWNSSLHLYHETIDRYIERVRLNATDHAGFACDYLNNQRCFSYFNISNGKINGVEWVNTLYLDEQSHMELFYSHTRGESDQSIDLNGIPADTVGVSAHARAGRCSLNWRTTWRDEHSRTGPDEAGLLEPTTYSDLGLACDVTQQLHTSWMITNIFDEQWRLNADTSAGFSRGRSVHVGVIYRF